MWFGIVVMAGAGGRQVEGSNRRRGTAASREEDGGIMPVWAVQWCGSVRVCSGSVCAGSACRRVRCGGVCARVRRPCCPGQPYCLSPTACPPPPPRMSSTSHFPSPPSSSFRLNAQWWVGKGGNVGREGSQCRCGGGGRLWGWGGKGRVVGETPPPPSSSLLMSFS